MILYLSFVEKDNQKYLRIYYILRYQLEQWSIYEVLFINEQYFIY